MRNPHPLENDCRLSGPLQPPSLSNCNLATSYPRLAMLAERFDVFVVDIWGVLIDGHRLIPGVSRALRGLVNSGKGVVLLTNSSRRAVEVTHMLKSIGLPFASRIPVLSSGELAHEAVRRDWVPRRTPVWVIGQQPGSDWIHRLGCTSAEGPQDAELLFAWGIVDCEFESRLQRQLERAAARGLPMICSNPDRAVYINGIRHVTAGVVASRYEGLGGKVQWFGKPDPQVFHRAVSMIGRVPIDRVVVIGDSLDTDMAGAYAAGCSAVWVTSEHSAPSTDVPIHAVFKHFAC